jgi:tyrosyl-tRNA synthetase
MGQYHRGVDLIRKVHGAKAHALVFPLLTTSSGAKFGKTESGAVWLDAKRTSPYLFYQFWLNSEDKEVINYLKYFTFLTEPEIAALAQSLAAAPEKRDAQRKLAQEVTRLVHGAEALQKAELASSVLFGAEMDKLSLADLLDVFANVPSTEIAKSVLDGEGAPAADLAVTAGLAQSKGEARRLLQGGGLYLNNRRITDLKRLVTITDAIEGQALVMRKGAREYRLVKIKS